MEHRCTITFDYDSGRYRYVVIRPIYYRGKLLPDRRLPARGPGPRGLGPDGLRRSEAVRTEILKVASEQLDIPLAQIAWEEKC